MKIELTAEQQAQLKKDGEITITMGAVLSKGFIPEYWEKYFIIDNDGDIMESIYDNDYVDEGRLSMGNCFPTEEAAEKALSKLKLIAKLWKEPNQIISPNWSDDEQVKYQLIWDNTKGGWSSRFCIDVRHNDWPIFKTDSDVMNVIEKYGNELDLLLC